MCLLHNLPMAEPGPNAGCTNFKAVFHSLHRELIDRRNSELGGRKFGIYPSSVLSLFLSL